MNKKLVASLVAAMLISTSGASLAATSPYEDVPTTHWAYGAIQQLANDGIIINKNVDTQPLTRHEFALIIANAMTKMYKASDADKELIGKLAKEFSSEFEVLIANSRPTTPAPTPAPKIEKKQDKFTVGGRVDIRNQLSHFHNKTPLGSMAVSQYRLYLDGKAKLDEKNIISMRFSNTVITGGNVKGNENTLKYIDSPFVNIAGGSSAPMNLDRLYLTSKIGDYKVTLGDQPLNIGGVTGLLADSSLYSIGGVRVERKINDVGLVLQHGLQQRNFHPVTGGTNLYISDFEAKTTKGKLNLGAGIAAFRNTGGVNNFSLNYRFINTIYNAQKNLQFGGEYVNNVGDAVHGSDYTKAWNIFTQIGKDMPDLKKLGDQNFLVMRFFMGRDSVTRLTGIMTMSASPTTPGLLDMRNQKGWILNYNYCLAKDLVAYLQYSAVHDLDAASTADGLGLHSYKAGIIARF